MLQCMGAVEDRVSVTPFKERGGKVGRWKMDRQWRVIKTEPEKRKKKEGRRVAKWEELKGLGTG